MHPNQMPSMVFADSGGNIVDLPSLSMAGTSGGEFKLPDLEDLIPLPEGSELFVLPGRLPVGYDPETEEPLLVSENPFTPGAPIQAVAAFMAPAYTAILTSGYQTDNSKAPRLPLFAYTAVGWLDDKFWVAGFRSDPEKRQDTNQFNQQSITARTKRKLKLYPNNRLIQHLGKCCLTYGCPAARNLFLNRWEAPLPTSPSCNASCIGCISLQKSGCCSATQDRIKFVPTAEEIAEIAVPHLQTADKPIVSFGQGCEGEPLLQAQVIEDSIHLIRKQTDRGTINLNSNSSLPDAVEKLAIAGLDSLRVSLNSAQSELHSRYYKPTGFCLTDVLESIHRMKKHNKFVSLNYFVLPGFTDSIAEFQALCHLLDTCKPHRIQLRNLNIDPEWYLQVLGFSATDKPMGIRYWLATLKEKYPNLQFGYFNPVLKNN